MLSVNIKICVWKNADNLRQRKETLLKKVCELGKCNGVDAALIPRQVKTVHLPPYYKAG